jgi:hypothetical protein
LVIVVFIIASGCSSAGLRFEGRTIYWVVFWNAARAMRSRKSRARRAIQNMVRYPIFGRRFQARTERSLGKPALHGPDCRFRVREGRYACSRCEGGIPAFGAALDPMSGVNPGIRDLFGSCYG